MVCNENGECERNNEKMYCMYEINAAMMMLRFP